MSLHIYTASCQPATGFTDHHFDPPVQRGYSPGKLLWTDCCETRRPARNLVVQCYYDGDRIWCAPGKGCKCPDLAKKKRRREFRNRSLGQKRRWAKAKTTTLSTRSGKPNR